MMSNIKIVLVLLPLLISCLVAEGQAREINRDKRAGDKTDCIWKAIKNELPPTFESCEATREAVKDAASEPCAQNAEEADLDGVVDSLVAYVAGRACSWTVDKLIEYFSNDAYQTKAHMPAVLLMAVGGIIVTRKHIL